MICWASAIRPQIREEHAMNKRSLLAIAAFCAAFAVPGIAAAQSLAYTASGGYTNMRSGPSTRYAVVAKLAPGTRLNTYGCLESREWCDAGAGRLRGWISASRLEFVYAGRRVLVPNYYTYFAPPVVVFRYGYWPRPYRRYAPTYGKPWFGHPGGGKPGPVYRDDRRRKGLEDVPRRRAREDGSRRWRSTPGCSPNHPERCVN
jgi:uncharacterized protein YraI